LAFGDIIGFHPATSYSGFCKNRRGDSFGLRELFGVNFGMVAEVHCEACLSVKRMSCGFLSRSRHTCKD
jgi:hypothetical protein